MEKTAARIDRHVVNTLLDKYSFVSHCSAIKRYLLLSQVQHHNPSHTNVMTVRTVRMCLFTPPGWQGCPRDPALMLTLLKMCDMNMFVKHMSLQYKKSTHDRLWCKMWTLCANRETL